MYNGRQTADTDVCGNTGRRVYMYAVEYNSYCGVASITTRPNGNKELNLRDHLGSVRSVVKASGVLEKYDYKPFGALDWSSSGTTKREGYIGKEMDRESNLGDFGVRKYDAEIGRFMSVDPLWESQPGYSPYHYAYNDPINGKDGSGLLTTPEQPCNNGCGESGCRCSSSTATDEINNSVSNSGDIDAEGGGPTTGGRAADTYNTWGGYLMHAWDRLGAAMSAPMALGDNSGLSNGKGSGGKSGSGSGNSSSFPKGWAFQSKITAEQKKELSTFISQSSTLTYLYNQINMELQKRNAEVYVTMWDKEYTVVSSMSSPHLKYNGVGTGGVTVKLSKDVFDKNSDARQILIHLVHEFWHIYEYITGTMTEGKTSNGLEWGEAYAEAWKNYVAKAKGWKDLITTEYYDPEKKKYYRLPKSYPDASKLPENKMKK